MGGKLFGHLQNLVPRLLVPAYAAGAGRVAGRRKGMACESFTTNEELGRRRGNITTNLVFITNDR